MKKAITILGGGESGTGAALLAQAKGYRAWVSDRGSIAPQFKAELDGAGIAYEEGQHTEEKVLAAELVVKSPGIPDTVPLVQKAQEQNIPVISEIEFAGRFIAPEAKTVLITGTNGKTTTTLLTHHLLQKAGMKVALGGNVGHSLARLALEGNYDVYVVEVSSFQLDGMYDFHADLATILNITPDHLDRYNYQLENYVDSKFRVLQNMTGTDHFVYSVDDLTVSSEVIMRKPAAKLVFVSRKPGASFDASIKDQSIVLHGRDHDWTFPTAEVAVKGPHNETNAMVAAVFAKLLGVGEEVIREGLATFRNAPHRMEPVGTINAVEFVNDSKATNVDAVKQSLASYPGKPIVWVAGGIDKGNDYSGLKRLVEDKVRALVCLGKDNAKLLAFAESLGKPVAETQSTEEALRLAQNFAQPGDVVLLAPACSSFDLFKNYMDRGDQFRQAVKEMTNKESTRDKVQG